MPSTRPPSERRCQECGGEFSVMIGKLDHRAWCSFQKPRVRESYLREKARRESSGAALATKRRGDQADGGYGAPAVVRPEARVWSLPDWQRIDERARRDYELVEDDPHAACACDRCSPDALYRGRSIDRLSDEIEAGRERMARRYQG